MHEDKKKEFLTLLSQGATTQFISEDIEVSVRTIERWRSQVKKGTIEQVRPRSGRPLKASIRDLRLLKRIADKEGPKSANELGSLASL